MSHKADIKTQMQFWNIRPEYILFGLNPLKEHLVDGFVCYRPSLDAGSENGVAQREGASKGKQMPSITAIQCRLK